MEASLRSSALTTLALTLTLGLTATGAAAQSVEPVRALWVDGQGQGLRSRSAISRLVATAQTGNFNTVVAVVRSQGDAHYPSSLEPRAENTASGFVNPLGHLINVCNETQGSEHPLRVFAAVNVLSVHRGATLPPRGHVAWRNPEWMMEDQIGSRDAREHGVIRQFLDPSIEQVRLHTAAVIRELVESHEIDALVLDDLRYPLDGSRWGYSALALANFHRAVGEVGIPGPGDLTFSEWRRDQATTLLRTIVETVRGVRPRLPVHVCVEANGSIEDGFKGSDTYRENLQDWSRWVDEGLCDGIIVKIFRDGRAGPEAEEFKRWLEFAEAFEPRTDVIIATGGQWNYRNGLFRQMRQVIRQGLGVALYDYDHPARDHGTRFFENLSVAVFRPLDEGELAQTPEGEATEAFPGSIPEATPAPPVWPTAPLASGVPETFPPAEEPLIVSPDSHVTPLTTAVGDFPDLDLSTTLPPPTDPALLDIPTPSSPEELAAPPIQTGIFEGLPAVSIPRPEHGKGPRIQSQDVVILIGGRQLTGWITEEHTDHIIIELESGNRVQIPRSRVQSIGLAPRPEDEQPLTAPTR